MAIFRKSSQASEQPVNIQRSSEINNKHHSYDVHDPVLSAMHDAQPFEMISNNARDTLASISPELRFHDIFGNVITQPDLSNPTRPRDERPLDTIRAFEYSRTGDERLRDEMETQRLGWSTRSNFNNGIMPHFESNPYSMAQPSRPAANNVISFNGESTFNTQDHVRDPPAAENKKQKRGIFGRKKKT